MTESVIVGAAPPPQEDPSARSLRNLRIGVALTILTSLIIAWQLGALEPLRDPSQLARTLTELGPWGYVAFVVAYALTQPFGVPGTLFVMAAPLIWPWPTAFALSMSGTMAASVVGFSVARFLARDWVAARIPARFRRYDQALAQRAFRAVVILRFVFWMPPLLHAFFGVSKVRFWTHFWGSVAGYAPPLLVVSYFGARLFAWIKELPLPAWLL